VWIDSNLLAQILSSLLCALSQMDNGSLQLQCDPAVAARIASARSRQYTYTENKRLHCIPFVTVVEYVCVCLCVCACVRACVCVCVFVCIHAYMC
jgi:hypothetical protein